MSVRIRDNKGRFTKRLQEIRNLKGSITVGVHAQEGNASYPGGTTVLDVAIWNEFGTDRIPARSFIRAWYSEQGDEVKALMVKLAHTSKNADQMWEKLGLYCVGQIQKRIADGVPPPNADSTVRQKGSSTPLIDTGQLRTSITFRKLPS